MSAALEQFTALCEATPASCFLSLEEIEAQAAQRRAAYLALIQDQDLSPGTAQLILAVRAMREGFTLPEHPFAPGV